MSTAVQAPEEVERRRHPDYTCECGEQVLVVEIGNRPVLIEATEVLPPMPCPLCRQIRVRGQDPGDWCYRCGGTEMIGDPLPQPGVLLDQHGNARSYDGERRRKGESCHRLHLHG